MPIFLAKGENKQLYAFKEKSLLQKKDNTEMKAISIIVFYLLINSLFTSGIALSQDNNSMQEQEEINKVYNTILEMDNPDALKFDPSWPKILTQEQERQVRILQIYFFNNQDALTSFNYPYAGTIKIPKQVILYQIFGLTQRLNDYIKPYIMKPPPGVPPSEEDPIALLDHDPQIIDVRQRLAAARVVWCKQYPETCKGFNDKK